MERIMKKSTKQKPVTKAEGQLPSLIGFAGFKNSGKAALANLFGAFHGYSPAAFTDAIRVEIQQTRGTLPVAPDRIDEPLCPGSAQTYRDLLIEHGRARREVDADYWIHAMQKSLARRIKSGQCIVITDVRLENEIKWIRAQGGIVVWVDVDDVDSDGSETEQDRYELCDYGVLNAGGPTGLTIKIAHMIRTTPSYQITKIDGARVRPSLEVVVPRVPAVAEASLDSSARSEAPALQGNPKPLRYFAVTGRIPGDDEDVTHLVDAHDRKDATDQFEAALWADAEDPEERERVEEMHGKSVYVTSVLVSDSPIEEL
jgi:hypothetical protein